MRERKKAVKTMIGVMYKERDFRGWWNSIDKKKQKDLIRDTANALITNNED
jgi:hypothetical protein